MDTSKIIKGIVNGRNYTVTSPIVKEDYGLVLKIEGVELPSSYQVDFSNSENSGTSVTMIGNADGVLIPHQFIDTGKDVFAFLYWVGEDFGKTVYKFRIPNKVRPDRTDDEPTPEEQSVIDQTIAALNEAVAQTAQDVISTDQSAQSAQGYAEQAETARDTAQTYANNAQTSATSAQTSASQASASATASANSASQSAQIKADVEELVDDAQASADASERSASNAYTYATSAERSSVNASSSAQSASGYASQAQSSANTASAKAQDASQSASTATQKATESAQSATTASNKATEASGYATASQTAQGLAESARDSAISAKADAESAKADAESARDEAVQAVESISGALDDKADIITDTASGAVASFTDGADNLPLKSLVVNIDPVQDTSSGDPSPENICPISGWTGMTVNASGKNIVDISRFATEYPNYCSFSNGVLTVASNSALYSRGINVDIPQGSVLNWTITNGTSVNARLRIVYEDGTVRSHSSPIPLTVSKRITALRFDWGAGGTFTVSNFQAELNTSATPYEPYQGQTIPITFGQTVYGGKLDILSGKLTVYPYYASYNGETLTGEWISDRDVYAVGTTPTIGAQVVNIGAEGTEYQLTPHKVKSLLGANNIWADTGDTEVEYRADTKLYIERLTAPDSADMIADANITSGQYFMVGNTLYKATANIANGGQIIVGTNCTRVSLAQALNEINA